ncbi:sensor domain-containing diguanylate cyclase [Stygiobacter electus]|uniref:GAF domain-containing protein n=1 Tax=Stygiobacter electus TaxID=3032292 RepID=A0AAE3NYM5_9BACT|nr:GAF domain-containing protein [Stygiobacter electus]MDF1611030.1 GAF domain-containing protein [Stygiobacter electus]
MGLDGKNKKRLLIFALVPILLIVPFLTDDVILRVISAIILIIYAGFIIFLRDTNKADLVSLENEIKYDEPTILRQNKIEPDFGEEIKIIGNKEIEILTAEDLRSTINQRGKDLLKPADLKQNYESIVNEELPADVSQDEQFGFVLEKILSVVKDAYMAHTAAFFWYNQKRKRITLERFVSSSSQITKQKYDLDDDIIGKIILNEEPEILSDIALNAESDIIKYYNQPQGIKSFVGVPFYYEKTLMGVLMLDSKVPDAFGIEQVYSLGKIVRVISVVINLFEKKFAETQAEQRLKTLIDIFSFDKKFADDIELISSIETAVKGLIDWDVFTFIIYNDKEKKFITSKIINNTSLKYIGNGLEIDLNNTLVGKSITSAKPIKIDDTSQENILPRFSKSEQISFDGSFLAVPLSYEKKIHGVLCFESLKKSVYSNNDVMFIVNATKIFAFILHSYSVVNLLKDIIVHDVQTNALTYDAFIERVNIELFKSNELRLQGALALIKIDDLLEQESLFEENPFPKIINSVAATIKEEMTPLNIFGRINEKIFAVYFFNTSPKDVYVWAEKLRIKIARKTIPVSSKQSTFTVSIGVASTTGKEDANDVIKNAELALNKALEIGGNKVIKSS